MTKLSIGLLKKKKCFLQKLETKLKPNFTSIVLERTLTRIQDVGNIQSKMGLFTVATNFMKGFKFKLFCWKKKEKMVVFFFFFFLLLALFWPCY